MELQFRLSMAGARETVTVSGAPPLVETVPSSVSAVVDERAINELPLNGRRFTDLALLAPGVTQDPRGLTSASNGDLAFGGIRGYQSSYLVDGADNNNASSPRPADATALPTSFPMKSCRNFASRRTLTARNSGGQAARSSTSSPSQDPTTFTAPASISFATACSDAQPAFLDFKPNNRQHQFGGTMGGPIRSNRIFFFAGYDQHIFHVPTVVNFRAADRFSFRKRAAARSRLEIMKKTTKPWSSPPPPNSTNWPATTAPTCWETPPSSRSMQPSRRAIIFPRA